jgi:cytochrome c oxidase cbb3-type subunit 4
MDIITDLRVIVTVLSFACFIGIVVWAYSGGQKSRFDEAANLPFADDEMQQRTVERAGLDEPDASGVEKKHSGGRPNTRSTSEQEVPHG